MPENTSFTLTTLAYQGVPFIQHTGDGEFKNYLALNINYPPIAELKAQIEAELRFTLKNRNEAHITVISPVEYDHVLRNKITMDDIHRVAFARKLQAVSWRPLCVGKGTGKIDLREESTYYIVVESPELLGIREDIQKLFVAKGGNASDFDPKLFFPHITVGFSEKDLHYEDGVVKDLRSCWRDLKVQAPTHEEIIVD